MRIYLTKNFKFIDEPKPRVQRFAFGKDFSLPLSWFFTVELPEIVSMLSKAATGTVISKHVREFKFSITFKF